MTETLRRIVPAGDSAFLFELEAIIDPEVNARAIAIAAAIRAAGCAGVRDVVSTFHSVAVYVDPLRTDVDALMNAVDEAQHRPAHTRDRPVVEVPVAYGGEYGPDLDGMAARSGVDVNTIVRRHAALTYRVFMLGFLPGFPYMASVDESIAVPRHPTPRLRVAAGSVGIAGRQTGIYPRSAPGGWQIIGRTPLVLFDSTRTPPALLAPGDRVRFVPLQRAVPSPSPTLNGQGVVRGESESGRLVTVLRPGLLTTVQDAGRWGYQTQGVPVSGPMDPVAGRLANRLVGNEDGSAVMESTLTGPDLRIEQDTTLAVTGADLGASADGVAIPLDTAVRCKAGTVLRFGSRTRGARAYIAFDGGVATPLVLGSRATHVVSGLGGLEGRALRSGDRVPLGPAARPPVHRTGHVGARPTGTGVRLRVVPGPQDECFTPAAFDALRQTRYTISPQSDRMGYRLAGGEPIEPAIGQEMISDATFTGALQVPPSGEPILLMADRQTTGGYPQIATVITADLTVAGQLAPGDWVEFEICTRAQAIAALIAQEAQIRAVG